MNLKVPRLRMFAGPNVSGKSTIKGMLDPSLIGVYVNPDDIEQQVKKCNYLAFNDFEINATSDDLQKFFSKSKLLQQSGLANEVQLLEFSENMISFRQINMNSYFASVCADFIRNKLLAEKKSFTFETVMSSNDKIEILKKAQAIGYRTYLYYVSTIDPSINEIRVKNRVSFGGHNVPKEKINSRYERSMNNLNEAIKFTNRAYIFDNTEPEVKWIAEITDSTILEIKSNSVPAWFDHYVLDKLKTESY